MTVWTQVLGPREAAAARPLCFPHAGGSPYPFRELGGSEAELLDNQPFRRLILPYVTVLSCRT